MVRVLKAVLFLLLTALVIALFALPLYLAIPFIILCVLLYRRHRRGELALMLVSLLLVFAAAEGVVRVIADDIFYRAHERWSSRESYRAGIHEQTHVRHGDLLAMDPSLSQLTEPREVTFVTDSLGYRNSADYQEEPYILLGDSYVAGLGNSQEDTLAYQFNQRGGTTVYSLGYPGEPWEYESRALTFFRHHPRHARLIWFVFEGNDLMPQSARPENRHAPTLLDEVGNRLSVRELPFLAPRFFALLFKAVKTKVENRWEPPEESPVEVHRVGDQEVGFLKSYITMAASQHTEFRTLGNPAILERTACVFVIPIKYRVYQPWIDDGRERLTPPPSVIAVNDYFRQYHIPVIDLAPVMQAVAAEYLPQGKVLYWRDDTHWNALGVASVLEAVDQCVQQDQARVH